MPRNEFNVPAEFYQRISVPSDAASRRAAERERIRVTARMNIGPIIDELTLAGVRDAGRPFVRLLRATAGAGKTSWPVWRSSVTRAQRSRGMRPRPVTAGRHSKDLFDSTASDRVQGYNGWWLNIRNQAPYARALERGAPPNRHGWRRPAGKFIERPAKRTLPRGMSETVKEQFQRKAEAAIRREAVDARRTARQRR